MLSWAHNCFSLLSNKDRDLTVVSKISNSISFCWVVRCSSVVERPLMVWGVVGSNPLGGPTELFLVPASASRLVKQRPWHMLSCLWNSAYKRSLLLIGKSSPYSGSSRFPLSCYLSGSLPSVKCIIESSISFPFIIKWIKRGLMVQYLFNAFSVIYLALMLVNNNNNNHNNHNNHNDNNKC